MRRFLAIGITWLALFGLSVLLGLLLFNPFPDIRLERSAVQTEGRVTAIEPTNHQIVRYSYSVGSQEYTGVGHGGHGNARFEDIRVGQTVLVFYDPTNPQSSSMGYPAARRYGNVMGVVFVSLILPILIIASLYRIGYFR